MSQKLGNDLKGAGATRLMGNMSVLIWKAPCASKNVVIWQAGDYIHTDLPLQIHTD